MTIISKIHNYLNTHKMVLRIIFFSIIFVLLLSLTSMQIVDKEKAYEQEIHSLQDANNKLEISLLKQENKITALDEMNDLLNQEVTTLTSQLSECNAEIENLTKENEKLKSNKVSITNSTPLPKGNYPEATYVHNYLRELGLNDYVVAGILGNIMAEVGGQTLDFSEWQKWSQSTYYGICQWSAGRKARLLNNFGSNLEAQCKFLGVELFEVIPQGSAFYGMTNEREAALYFAKVYERCNSKYYNVRQNNATKALNYFRG